MEFSDFTSVRGRLAERAISLLLSFKGQSAKESREGPISATAYPICAAGSKEAEDHAGIFLYSRREIGMVTTRPHQQACHWYRVMSPLRISSKALIFPLSEEPGI